MNKTGQMIEFEEETGNSSTTIWRGECNVSNNYIEWLEAELLKASVKAAAYDRLMSGGKSGEK